MRGGGRGMTGEQRGMIGERLGTTLNGVGAYWSLWKGRHDVVAVGEKFRAARLETPGEVTIKDYQRQPLGPPDLFLQIDLCGVCGSDVHWVHATPEAQARMTYPMYLGHEWTGTIEEMGERAPKVDIT